MMTRSAIVLAMAVVACGGSSTSDGATDGGPGTGGAGAMGGSAGTGGSSATAGSGAGASSGADGGSSGSFSSGGAGGDDGPCGPGGCLGGTSNASPIEPPGPVMCGGVECAAPRACCIGTGQCYDPNTNPDACSRPPADDDPWGRQSCGSNAHCGSREYCQLENGLCTGAGHCHPIGNCGECWGSGSTCRVCGCDGNTYPDIQTACLAGTSVVGSSGAGCGETFVPGGGGAGGTGEPRTACGSSTQCPTGELCCSITGFCFPSTDPDQCRLPPPGTRFPCTSNAQCESSEYCLGEGCSGPGGCVPLGAQTDCGVTLSPVCGCDGITYTSAACAASRGVRVASTGECVNG